MRSFLPLPDVVEVSRGVLGRVGDLIAGFFSPKKVLFLSGSGPTRRILSSVLDGYSGDFRCGEVECNSKDEVERLSSFTGDVDLIVGVGGGKVLDVAKVLGDLSGVDVIAVPTTLSHDGIASPIAVLVDGKKGESVLCKPPKGVFVDLGVVSSAPLDTLKAGVGDLLSNLSAIEDWKLARDEVGMEYYAFSVGVSKASAEMLLMCKGDILDNDFVETLAEGLILSGTAMRLAGSSKPASGAEHLISHSLDLLLDRPARHGLQVALGLVFISWLRDRDPLGLRNFLASKGVPTTPEELGIPLDVLEEAILLAPTVRDGRFTILHHLSYTREDVKRWMGEVWG